MQQDAIDCATQALEKYNIEKDIAAFIKKESLGCTLNPRGSGDIVVKHLKLYIAPKCYPAVRLDCLAGGKHPKP